MFKEIADKIRARGKPTTVDELTEALTDALSLPSVYKPEVVHKGSGRRASGTKGLDLADLDVDDVSTVGDVKRAVEDAYPDDDLSVRITSPTDKDGISERMHLKTLREAAE